MWLSSWAPKFRRNKKRSIFNGFIQRRGSVPWEPNQFNVLSVVNIVKSYPDLLLNCIESLMIKDINFTFESNKFLRLFQIAVSSHLKRIKFINWTIPNIRWEDFVLYKPKINKQRYLESISFINWNFDGDIDSIITIANQIKGLSFINLSQNNFSEDEAKFILK